MNRRARHILRSVLETAAFLLVLWTFLVWLGVTGRALLPEQTGYGIRWDAWQQEPEDSIDVIFAGSSMTYCDIIPAEIYRQTGCRSYVVSSPVCSEPTLYWQLREALRTQHPKQVLLEMSSLFVDEYTDYGFGAVSCMPMTLNRAGAAFTSVEPSRRAGVIFPFWSLHQRWKELTAEDFRRPAGEPDIWAGYTLLGQQEAIGEMTISETSDDANVEKNLFWLEQVLDLCEKRGIQVFCFFSPRCNHMGEEEVETARAHTEGAGYPFRSFQPDFDAMGLDMSADFADWRHLNFRGAVKFTDWLCAAYGADWRALADGGEDPLWQSRVLRLRDVAEQNGISLEGDG